MDSSINISSRVDGVYRTRSLGVPAEGLPDQYADGKAAKVWQFYIGSKQSRTTQYKTWLCDQLRGAGCSKILDVACGTGIDSIMLVEEGFTTMSTDASDKMLKYALKERWARRKEEAFDKWEIEEANWLRLSEDLQDIDVPEASFDAVLCLGNSFAHLPDFEGQLAAQRQSLENFKAMLKPGGILIIDHRNYDAILSSGAVPAKNVYYSSNCITDIKVSNLYVGAKPTLVTLDYHMDSDTILKEGGHEARKLKINPAGTHTFRLSYYPHRVAPFSKLLKEVFGENSKHELYGDFKPYNEKDVPAYFIHVIQNPA